MTDRQQLERLMFLLGEVREAQANLNEKKKTVKDFLLFIFIRFDVWEPEEN